MNIRSTALVHSTLRQHQTSIGKRRGWINARGRSGEKGQIATVVPAVQSHAKSSIALLAAVVNAGTLTGQDQYV
eukprot:1642579-Rhodomonas_salina.3